MADTIEVIDNRLKVTEKSVDNLVARVAGIQSITPKAIILKRLEELKLLVEQLQ